ncbi:hypothetical protein LSH36_1014g00012 [Paralvinella palmiformis]|uniref:G-protein coupled receptors family 1 profile domain-containing protein n=1 Tax=Paralvinella palmiformis TaxID=53620 RepID=A0AAD9IXL8_9ANNE|nr:hypothetical protein LSH36_1014g00012 [Paralvinella palmiformis]
MALNGTTPDLQRTILEYTFRGILCLETLFILAGNAMTFVAIKRVKKLREIPTNIFVLSLAASDGMVGIITPIFIALKILKIDTEEDGMICLLQGSHVSMFLISLVTLLAVAVDRYLAVVHPLTYRQRMTIKRARIVTVLIWLLSFGLITSLSCYYGTTVLNSNTVRSLFPKAISLVLLQVMILGPVLGNIAIYVLIYVKLKTKRRVGSEMTRSNFGGRDSGTSRATKAYVNMMALVLGYLIFASMPNYLLLATLRQMPDPKPKWFVLAYDISVILFYSNSFMNPVIYSWKNRNFRAAYKHIMRCNRSSDVSVDESMTEGSRIENRSATITS